MHVVCINGAINSGKTTIGRLVAVRLPRARFLDGDDHDAPSGAPLADRIEAGIQRLELEVADADSDYLVIAHPLRDEDFHRLRRAAGRRGGRIIAVTLAPPLEIVLSDRGERRLSNEERRRIVEMHREGYFERSFSSLFIHDVRPPEAIAGQIADFVVRA